MAGGAAARDHQERRAGAARAARPARRATLEALPESSEASGGGEASGERLPGAEGAGSIPLPLTPGTQTKILPSGLAAAGEEAPGRGQGDGRRRQPPVRRELPLRRRARHIAQQLQPAYDCSSAVSYVLHAAACSAKYAEDSTELESYGEPGPGRYVSIYANAAHAFMYVGGLRFDTVEDPAYDSGPNSGKPGPRWRVSASVPDWATWTVRHPPGL